MKLYSIILSPMSAFKDGNTIAVTSRKNML